MNLRDLERESIRDFVQSAADEGYLSGRVLDYGCGRMPYREIVEAAGGEYHGFDRAYFPANVSGEHIGLDEGPWDSILCTQVVQYVPDEFDPHDHSSSAGVWGLLDYFHSLLSPERSIFHPEQPGHLVLTYPTHWPEVEAADLHRFTKAGMERLLTEAGFTIITHEQRASIRVGKAGVFNAEDFQGWLHGTEDFALGYGVIARA